MNGDLNQLVGELAASYALSGLLVAFTLAAVLNALGLLRVPQRARPAFFGVYAALVAGFAGAYAVGALKSPSQAAAEVAAVAESDVAAGARARNVRPVDHDVVTGSLPAGVVYIQAPDMDSRFAADGMWKALKAAGFRSPGIELVAGGAPSRPEVRYFNEADRPIADRVAAIAAGQGLKGAAVMRAAASYQAPRGQIELWYPR